MRSDNLPNNNLYNYHMKLGEFPTILKTGCVTPSGLARVCPTPTTTSFRTEDFAVKIFLTTGDRKFFDGWRGRVFSTFSPEYLGLPLPQNFDLPPPLKCRPGRTDPYLRHWLKPIYKKTEVDCIANYRPISILPILGKIFEKIIYTRFCSFVLSKNILSDTRLGFCKQHCTIHAIHHSVNFIKKSHSKGVNVLGIFIDLSKAFDTIDHNTTQELYHYGVWGTPYNLLNSLSYLKNRFQ